MAIENENEKRETVADIVAQIRAAAYIQNADTPKSVLRFADRIEAAWKHEREEAEADALSVGGIVEAARIAEKSSAVGNVAAMREALEDVLEKIDRWRTDGVMEHCQYSQLFDIADSALAAPARNCDVGTAEEQNNRFRKFCGKQPFCEGCKMPGRKPLHDIGGMKCALAWAQMPYEAQEGDGK